MLSGRADTSSCAVSGVQRHCDPGEVDRRVEESDQGQREPDESRSDEASHTPVQTER